MVAKNVIQDGPGAASGYPFTSLQSFQSCSCLADLSISVTQSTRGLRVVIADPAVPSLHVIDESGATVFSSLQRTYDVVRVKNFLLVQWKDDSIVVNATFDLTGVKYAGVGLPLCDRVVYDRGDVVTSLEILSPDLSTEITDAFSMRGGFNTDTVANGSDITINVAAGLGEGQYEDCLSDINAVRSIGGAKPDELGNISFTGDDCIRVVPELVDTENGYYVSPARFYLYDDCEACCRCEEKASVWRVAKDLQNKLVGLVDRYHKLREGYNGRVSEIQLGTDCNTRPLLHADLIADIDNNWNLYINVCNGTDERIEALQIRVSPLLLRSASGVSELVRRKYKDTPKEFFDANPGVIELPDYDGEFISLHEAIRRAMPVNIDLTCRRGYIYTVGKKKHIKMPGGTNVLQTPYNESGYRIVVDRVDPRLFDIKHDGGITIEFHCLEPGDTRYFTATLTTFPAADTDILAMDSIKPRELALIVWSPNNSSLNVVAKTGTGFGADCHESS